MPYDVISKGYNELYEEDKDTIFFCKTISFI